MECLEDFSYILREKCVPAESLERLTVRFLGRTIGEFKQQIFDLHYGSTGQALDKNISVHDIEIIHNGEILEDRAEIEYCINTEQNPLVVYVPIDIDYAEFKYQSKFCQDKIADLKKHSLAFVETKSGRYLDLQLELQEIMEAIARAVPTEVAQQIRANFTQKKQAPIRYSGKRPYGLRKGETSTNLTLPSSNLYNLATYDHEMSGESNPIFSASPLCKPQASSVVDLDPSRQAVTHSTGEQF